MQPLWRWLEKKGGAAQWEMGLLIVSLPESAESFFYRQYRRISKAYTRRATPLDDYCDLVDLLRERGASEDAIEDIVGRMSASSARLSARKRKRFRIRWPGLVKWFMN
jgi:hypothetical protein